MSDTQGNVPEEHPTETADAAAAETAPATQPEVETPAPAASPVTHPGPPPATPPAGWQVPSRPTPPAGYPAAPQGYARPQGWAGPPAPAPQYAGQPPYGGQPPHLGQQAQGAGQQQGAAFGARPGDAQPTLPLSGAAGVPTDGVPALASSGPARKSNAGRIAGIIVAAALVGGAAGLGGAYAGVTLFAPTGTSPAAGPSTVTVNDTGSVNATTGIAAKVVPSVVTIQAASSDGSGTGSGVVLTSDGYVVTNTHVVTLDGATADAQIRVTASDGKVYDAQIVGTDPTYDLAVIKLADAEGLTPIEFADSSKLNVGDETVAIGAPLGLANTVTTGIVSALNRSIEIASSAAPDSSGAQGDGSDGQQDPGQGQGEGQTPPFFFDYGQGQGQQTATETIKIAVIQTDAAINPGNSGGALVDAEGKLIGINVAIASAGGGASGQSGNIGVGFSIPANIVQRITDELIADGAATHGLLGASVQSATSVEGATITGAYIAEVVAGGAAAAAGLQQGDIVTAFDDVPVSTSVDLTAQVRAAAAGSEATVTFVRDGKTQTADVTLGTLE